MARTLKIKPLNFLTHKALHVPAPSHPPRLIPPASLLSHHCPLPPLGGRPEPTLHSPPLLNAFPLQGSPPVAQPLKVSRPTIQAQSSGITFFRTCLGCDESTHPCASVTEISPPLSSMRIKTSCAFIQNHHQGLTPRLEHHGHSERVKGGRDGLEFGGANSPLPGHGELPSCHFSRSHVRLAPGEKSATGPSSQRPPGWLRAMPPTAEYVDVGSSPDRSPSWEIHALCSETR